MTSPTQRSKALLEEQGYLVAIVERWNPYARIRQDLFGLFDLLAVGNALAGTVAVQVTSGSNVSARVRKIGESPHIAAIRGAGWTILVHGWRKNAKGKWVLRVIDLS